LKSTDQVLDVGCGCGRMALPLTNYLSGGSYEGFDVVGEMIDWCRENISSRFPNFQFTHVDLYNGKYNKTGTIQPSEFQFPYPDSTFDFTFLTSIFTHLLEDDVAHYLREIARTLKPAGTAVMTFYILNEESERLAETPKNRVPFPHAWGRLGMKVGDDKHPEAVVAYPEEMLRGLLLANGLRIQEPLHYGSWCGRAQKVSFQDLIVAKRK
jgi:SAM-dependent methyltransferase